MFKENNTNKNSEFRIHNSELLNKKQQPSILNSASGILNFKPAFTLVELIVVIVILAILATIAFLSFSSQSGSARDSTRLADMSSIKKGVEMYNVNSGVYPVPDSPIPVTYSGGAVWIQGKLGDSAFRLIKQTLSKKVTDPLSSNEYDYSLASNKREYQVAGNMENTTSFEKNYNPFNSLALNSPEANALGGTGANVYISGNYNGVMLKVQSGSYYHYIPAPTLFGANPTNLPTLTFNSSFNSGTIILPGINSFAQYDSTKIYSTTGTTLSSTGISDLMTMIQSAYLTSNITSPQIQQIVSANSGTLSNLGIGLIKNSLGGETSSYIVNDTNTGNTGAVTPPDTSNVLLLHGDNTANPTSFIDSSPSPKAITANGNVTQVGKFGGIGFFNGSSSYLSIPQSTDFDFGSSDVTIDFWVKLNTLSGNPLFFGQSADSVLGSKLDHYAYYDTTGGTVRWAAKMEVTHAEWITNVTLTAGVWTHIGLIKSGNKLYISKNGVISDTTTTTGIPSGIAAPFTVGNGYNAGCLNGYLEDFRISKGIARWTTNFTAPTNTVSPDSNDVFLLNFNGNLSSFTDSAKSKTINTTGTPTQITPKFGNGAVYFDGAGDILGAANNNDFNFGSGDFTVDFWMNHTSGAGQYVLSRWNTANHSWAVYLKLAGENPNGISLFTGNAANQETHLNTSGLTLNDNTWYHIAIVRSNNYIDIYCNGVSYLHTPFSSVLYDNGEPVRVGGYGASGEYYNGYLDELRISKGVARWTTNFTPPTLPY